MYKKIAKELTYPDGEAAGYRVRLGKTLASALAGFIAGVAGTTFYFWYVFTRMLPTYCELQKLFQPPW